MNQQQDTIRLALQKTMRSLEAGRITIQESIGLSDETVLKLISSGKPFLLTDTDDSAKSILFRHLGIRTPGSSPYLLVRPLGKRSGRVIYHLIEAAGMQDRQLRKLKGGSGHYDGPPPQTSTSHASAEGPETALTTASISLADIFARAVARIWDTDLLKAASSDDGPETHQWFYTKTYAFWLAGESYNNYTPPEQLVDGSVTFTFQAFLDIAETGNFQWLYLNTLGYWETNGMVKNDHDHRGWGTGALGISIPTPTPGDFGFYQCSPENANQTSQVTTTVGFEVGYKTGNLNFSESKTETLSDWEVTLESINNWQYQMSNPYKGNSTEFPDDAIKYNAAKARHEIKSWPDLTTTVFNWDTMSVWRTNSVFTGTVNVNPTITYRPNFIYLHNTWPSWDGSYWSVGDPDEFSESFQLDMSVVS